MKRTTILSIIGSVQIASWAALAINEYGKRCYERGKSDVCLNMTRIMVESMVTSHSDSKEDGEVEKEA